MWRICMVFSPVCCLSGKTIPEGSLAAVTTGEDVVPASELAAAIKIKELQPLLGKNMEVEILKEATEYTTLQ